MANSLKEKYDAKTVAEYDRILNELPELLFDELSREEFYSDAVISIAYHLSTLKSAKRAYAMELEDCNCSTYDSYVGGKSPFFCSEDKLVSRVEALELFNGKRARANFLGRKFIPTKTINYLKQLQKDYVAASYIDLILNKEFNDFWTNTLTEKERKSVLLKVSDGGGSSSKQIVPNCLFYHAIYGSDCGCCANYDFYCLYCSYVCYKHDKACEECDKWWCLPGCVPSVCTYDPFS